MQIPGFTAEASLHRAHEQYWAATTTSAALGGQAVIPQACWWVGPCVPFVHRRLRCCTHWWPPFVRCNWRQC
jgi:hypothetical protein